jgi:hypothetical protein
MDALSGVTNDAAKHRRSPIIWRTTSLTPPEWFLRLGRCEWGTEAPTIRKKTDSLVHCYDREDLNGEEGKGRL